MKFLKYGSVCSGIESASMAWEPLGMRASWFAEVEKFPSAVLAHHWPEVPNVGDMCNLPYLVAAGIVDAPDILVGGTPCQAFSVAGRRKGLEDERGKLTLKFVELANEIDKKRKGNECVTVWENVPGVLSSKDNAFGCFLGALSGEVCELKPAGGKWANAGCVFGPERSIAWRILDAQYFGVAQRRRRVFVVASARQGFNPQQVLFESEGLRRDIAPSRKALQNITPSTKCGFTPSSFERYREGTGTLKASGGDLGGGSETLVTHGTQDPCVSDNLAFALGRNNGAENVVAFQTRYARNGRGGPSEIAYPLTAQAGTTGKGDSANCVTNASAVRRLTPIECERLQGFPDNHTRIPWRGKLAEDCPDGPRYKACGNSKAVPVIKFIGERILKQWNK
jgi:DNA (cytosine-5)-methyltransferase 1